jgi:integrase
MGHDLRMTSRVHPNYKTKYRASNWADYDRTLVQRGDITLWISQDAIASWKEKLEGLEGEALHKHFALVKNSLSVLRSGLNWYWNEHELDSACPARWIAEQTRRIRTRFEIPEQRRKAAYTPEELVILLGIAQRRFPVLFDMWAIDAATGLRFGELLGLEWACIDWLRSTVVPQFQIDDRGKPVLPKSERNLERDGRFAWPSRSSRPGA